MQKKALIFDMDGVLLDSEPYYYDYLYQRFAELGLTVTEEEYNGFVGLPTNKVWSYLEKANNINLGIENLLKYEEEQVNIIFMEAPLEPITGVKDLLDVMASLDILMGVASSSSKSTIQLIIEKLGLSTYFKFLVSGTEVENGKPHPDIFLKAAQLHNVSPENCIVIEDSKNGIMGAKRAGMTCVGFRNPGSGQQDLSEADIVIDSYSKENIDSIIRLL
jgi:HAD superfamily hydrolase (TIGR01509 family)